MKNQKFFIVGARWHTKTRGPVTEFQEFFYAVQLKTKKKQQKELHTENTLICYFTVTVANYLMRTD